MLSRTASHLYWMARYIERAENLTRLMHVAQTFALMPASKGGHLELAAPLAITGSKELFQQSKNNSLNLDNIRHFFACGENNNCSISNCLTMARENAHAVRGTITSDIWECLNETYFDVNNMVKSGLTGDKYETFLDKILERYQVYFGAVMSTMQLNDAYNFIRTGHMIERADNTARAINVKFQNQIFNKNKKPQHDEAVEYHQLTSLLKAMSAYEAYHTTYGDTIVPEKVAEFLILSDTLPRSLSYCVMDLSSTLNSIEGDRGLVAKRLSAELKATLGYSSIEQCMIGGIDKFITNFLQRICCIGISISHSYLEVA
jgi:uncharacterized alpha-E superfamily protein